MTAKRTLTAVVRSSSSALAVKTLEEFPGDRIHNHHLTLTENRRRLLRPSDSRLDCAGRMARMPGVN
jgi:hypothetical protein